MNIKPLLKKGLLLGFFLGMTGAVFCQSGSLLAAVSTLIKADSARITEIFKDIHSHPELGFNETRTAAIVDKELKALGYKTLTGIGKTGVVGILENGLGPVVMYRADMDCNAVKETTGLPYASTKVIKRDDGSEMPVMHACGHDAHTTWLIAAAKIMAELRSQWSGTLVFVAQPAEEPITGAEAMVNDGLYNKGVPKPDYLFGLHTAPVALGLVSAAKGVRMAGTDQIDIVFNGIGGHGSTPQLSKDPIVMAASAILQYQAIISRSIDPLKSAVLTVGAIQAGSDNNVIPATALVKVNLRWFDKKDRDLMIQGIKRINEGIAYAYDMPKEMYPVMTMKGWAEPLENSAKLTEIIYGGLKSFIPQDHILTEKQLGAIMGSEDFHHLVIHNEKKEYCYANVGVADPAVFAQAVKEGRQLPYNAHNGDFVVDLRAIPFGAKVAAVGLLEIFRSENARNKPGKNR